MICQRALAFEMKKFQLDFIRDIEQIIYYKTLKDRIVTRRADFVVESKV